MKPLIKSLVSTIVIVSIYLAADHFLGGIDIYKKDYSELFSSVMIALAVFFWYHFFKTEKETVSEENHEQEGS